MRVLNRPAERFQRALEGERVTDEETAFLLATSRHLDGLGATGPTPDPAFVAGLRERLMVEAATLPTPSPAAARAAAARRAAARSTPVVVVVGRGVPRLVAGAVASLLLVGALVGAVSRSSVPGDALYPVKGWLDSVAVRLAGSDFDRGQTYLLQAQEHLSDARDLADQPGRHAREINMALQGAIDSVRGGQRSLDAAYAATGNPQALLALRDFTARALPQIDALRTEVPVGSLPRLAELEALLRDTQDATARRIAACGAPCASSLQPTSGSAQVPSPLTTSPSGSATSPTGLSVPGSSITAGGAGPAPGISAGSGGISVGSGKGGATLSKGGATLNLPTITGSVPGVPHGSASVPLPSATIGTRGASATVPSSTLGPLGLPGATISLP